MQDFYTGLQLLGASFEYRSPKTCGLVSKEHWTEAVDNNCRIIVCAGDEDFGKPYALAVMHGEDLKIQDAGGSKKCDGNLCGKVGREVKLSPVWIADLSDYQVVTVFGATADPRRKYLQHLSARASGTLSHRLGGLAEKEVFKAWDVTNSEQWQKRVLNCLNLVTKQSFKSLSQASSFAQIHNQVVAEIAQHELRACLKSF
ncbi:MAG: hypothetical protein PUP91_30930 [Rhizonema sp. PD37]|nr:hypothetical protein [Rhizonema sp. PD37]